MGSDVDRELSSGVWTSRTRVDVLHGGRAVASLRAPSGVVEAQAGRPALRSLQAVLVDPNGALTEGSAGALLDVYDSELAAYRGVRLATLSTTTASVRYEDVWAPLGVFRLTGRHVNGDGTLAVDGLDRAMRYQGPMTRPLPIPAGTPIEQAIELLLAERNPGVVFAHVWRTGFTVGPLLFKAGSDVWREALSLAESVGGWLYHDRTGGLVLAPLASTSDRPVARFSDGPGGRLIEAERSEDSDTIHNVVVVESAKAGLGGVIGAVVEDTDPTSPTYSRGRYGRRPGEPHRNQHIGSVAQAQQMAATLLARELGRSETTSAVTVVDPRIDPLDVVTINRPRAGLYERGLLVETVRIPLGVREPMHLGLHRSIRAQDGRVLDVPLELAA